MTQKPTNPDRGRTGRSRQTGRSGRSESAGRSESSDSPPGPYTPCPVIQEALKVFEATQDLVRSFRKLRLAMRRCRECEHLDGCPAIHHFHQSIDIALEELVDEWGLNDR